MTKLQAVTKPVLPAIPVLPSYMLLVLYGNHDWLLCTPQPARCWSAAVPRCHAAQLHVVRLQPANINMGPVYLAAAAAAAIERTTLHRGISHILSLLCTFYSHPSEGHTDAVVAKIFSECAYYSISSRGAMIQRQDADAGFPQAMQKFTLQL